MSCLWNTILALSGVVIKELYRRKDFYVSICPHGGDYAVARVSEFLQRCQDRQLLERSSNGFLIWVAALVIAITTTARQIPPSGKTARSFPCWPSPFPEGR